MSSNRSGHWRRGRVQVIREPEGAYLPYPNRFSVSEERADNLRADFLTRRARWLETATGEQREGWAETFAPDHPEWFGGA